MSSIGLQARTQDVQKGVTFRADARYSWGLGGCCKHHRGVEGLGGNVIFQAFIALIFYFTTNV